MLLDQAIQAEARARADRLLMSRSDDDCWLIVEALLVRDAVRMRQQAIEVLKLEFLREALCPGLTRDQWRKLGWNSARNSREAARRFIRKVRAASAAGSLSANLNIHRASEE